MSNFNKFCSSAMNLIITKSNQLKLPALRLFCTQCPLTPIGGTPDFELQNTTLPNGLIVSSAENYSAITRITIMVRAGSRFEPPEIPGLVHALKSCAGLSTKNASTFAINRTIQQHGATLTCTGCQEIISYNLYGTRAAIEKTLPFLTEVATQQEFRPWEVSDNLESLKVQVKNLPPLDRVHDLLFRAAFRKGCLGNSLYISEYNIENISSESLQHYFSNNFTSGRTVVTALGVDHLQLIQYAQTLNLKEGEATPSPSPYKGGEIRIDGGGDKVYVGLAAPGLNFKDFKQTIIMSILNTILFGDSSSKNGLLGKSLKEISKPFRVIPFQAIFSDEGLFGVLISADKEVVGEVVKAAAKTLKMNDISEEDFKKGANLAKINFLMNCESGCFLVSFMGKQSIFSGISCSPKDMMDSTEDIKIGDVQDHLKKISGKKLSLVAMGNLMNVPYLDELGS